MIKNTLKCIVAVGVSELAGIVGSVFTIPSIGAWYATLAVPPLSPPSWVFGPVWTTLFALMGIAAFLVWKEGWGNRTVRYALFLFLFQLALNVLWTIIFFAFGNPGLACIEIIVLWIAIRATMAAFGTVSSSAQLLLVPYMLWVSFAAYLNFGIWFLNR